MHSAVYNIIFSIRSLPTQPLSQTAPSPPPRLHSLTLFHTLEPYPLFSSSICIRILTLPTQRIPCPLTHLSFLPSPPPSQLWMLQYTLLHRLLTIQSWQHVLLRRLHHSFVDGPRLQRCQIVRFGFVSFVSYFARRVRGKEAVVVRSTAGWIGGW